MFRRIVLLLSALCLALPLCGQIADRGSYLEELKVQLGQKWPDNQTVNVVFHGHSVPAGYARTPVVNTLHAYPHLTLCGIKERYPTAVVNVIVTAIGVEQSEQGAERFEAEVLTHRPDVLLIDYALNDRTIGLERSEKAWRKMIEAALARGVKVILLTPTPDLSENILAEEGRLAAHAEQIRCLAAEYHVGLADVYEAFRARALAGEKISIYMSQVNHPNALGHSVAAAEILPWFF